jgi:hypothetical protein
MPSPKPKKGWKASGGDFEFTYSPESRQEIITQIENAFNGELSEEDKNELLSDVGSSASDFKKALHQHQKHSGPTLKEMASSLDEVERAAEKLISVFNDLDDASLAALSRQCGAFHHMYRSVDRDSGDQRDNYLLNVRAISEDAKAARSQLKKPHAPELNEILATQADFVVDPISPDIKPLELFVAWLADAFFEYTGGVDPKCYYAGISNTYKGNFLPFSRACISPVRHYSDSTLGKTSTDGLSLWREEIQARIPDVPEE